ncbi:hypothetical protein Rrhod_0539 [Rhodococcus rhodnii LMG 5362]|uniref:Chitinase n=2 Tax=Rhodococcus rhodnii TaxID=38312 RepID=R7WVB1_9NOCA|nr:hypothetical protein [Rhodococcus rhodnii]EOM78089.1 hypothetical protein Rrhod_0539 [Rhodococcus rhodnii LMG 5362]
MDAQTLRAAMQETYVSQGTLEAYLPHFEEAMRAAEITTPRRAAAWCSQIGHESAGLRYMAEIQTNGPGWTWDRIRYRGRGPIQLTWSSNYRRFGQWCRDRGYASDSELFVNQPELVEQPRWGFLAASWYWLNGGPRPGEINAFADQGNLLNVSRCVNGWVTTPNGMPDRQARYDRCLAIGAALLPDTNQETDLMGEIANQVKDQLTGPAGKGWPILGRAAETDGSRDRYAVEAIAAILVQLGGPTRDGLSFQGWDQLGDGPDSEAPRRTLVDAIAHTIRQNEQILAQQAEILALLKEKKA